MEDKPLKDIVPGDEIDQRRAVYAANKMMAMDKVNELRKDSELKESLELGAKQMHMTGSSLDPVDAALTTMITFDATKQAGSASNKSPDSNRPLNTLRWLHRIDILGLVACVLIVSAMALYTILT